MQPNVNYGTPMYGTSILRAAHRLPINSRYLEIGRLLSYDKLPVEAVVFFMYTILYISKLPIA